MRISLGGSCSRDSSYRRVSIELTLQLHGCVMSGASLTWSQPRAFRRCYELRHADGLIGELSFPGPFTTKARATVGHSVWDIRAHGRQHNLVLVARSGSDSAEVTFTRHWLWSDGFLDFRGQAPLRVRRASLRRRLLLQTSDGERVLSLRYRGIVHSRCELHFGPRCTPHDPTLLAVTAWYLVVTGVFQSGSDYAFS